MAVAGTCVDLLTDRGEFHGRERSEGRETGKFFWRENRECRYLRRGCCRENGECRHLRRKSRHFEGKRRGDIATWRCRGREGTTNPRASRSVGVWEARILYAAGQTVGWFLVVRVYYCRYLRGKSRHFERKRHGDIATRRRREHGKSTTCIREAVQVRMGVRFHGANFLFFVCA